MHRAGNACPPDPVLPSEGALDFLTPPTRSPWNHAALAAPVPTPAQPLAATPSDWPPVGSASPARSSKNSMVNGRPGRRRM